MPLLCQFFVPMPHSPHLWLSGHCQNGDHSQPKVYVHKNGRAIRPKIQMTSWLPIAYQNPTSNNYPTPTCQKFASFLMKLSANLWELRDTKRVVVNGQTTPPTIPILLLPHALSTHS